MKNTLINNFNVWQRGDSFTAGGGIADETFTADRWILLSDGTVVDIDKETSDVPQGSVSTLKATVVTVDKKYGFLQIIEQQNCQQLIGATVSLSFKTKSKGVKNMRAAVLSFTGTTADTIPDRDVVSDWKAEGTNPVLIANWAYENGPSNLELTPVYQTYKIENIQISSNAKNLAVFIWSDDMSDGTVGDELLIGQVQLEKGAVATDFEYRSIGEELALCQRYYCKTFDQETAPANGTLTLVGTLFGGNAALFDATEGTENLFGANWQFPVAMRSTPSITLYNPGAGTIRQWADGSLVQPTSGARYLFPSERGCFIDNTGLDETGLSPATWFIHATAEKEL